MFLLFLCFFSDHWLVLESLSISYWMLNYRFEDDDERSTRSRQIEYLCTFFIVLECVLPSEQHTSLTVRSDQRHGQHFFFATSQTLANNVHGYTQCILPWNNSRTFARLILISTHIKTNTQLNFGRFVKFTWNWSHDFDFTETHLHFWKDVPSNMSA